MAPSTRIALDDLKLEGVAVVYPGDKQFPIAPGVEAIALCEVLNGALFKGVMG